MSSIFTTSFPSIDHRENQRLGYRYPIKVILPQYLVNNKLFEEFYDAVDEVYDKYVYKQIEELKNLRNMWFSNPGVEMNILENKMINMQDWSIPANEVVVKQLSTLGLTLGKSAGLFKTEHFLTLCRHLGQYWYEKGTNTFVDFVNFCCNTRFEMKYMWTEDYEHFYDEGDEKIGTPIWLGGTWYPTTHVSFKTKDMAADPLLVSLLFNEIANYNLVLHTIKTEFDLDFGGNDGQGAIRFGKLFTFNEEIHVGRDTGADWWHQNIFGFKDQNLHNFDHGVFMPEERKYQDDTVFGFEGSRQGSFNNPFGR